MQHDIQTWEQKYYSHNNKYGIKKEKLFYFNVENELQGDKRNNEVLTPTKDSEQLQHQPSLIFTAHMEIDRVLAIW